MTVIRAEGLVREFVTYRRQPGLRGAVRGLFAPQRSVVRAVDGVSFTVEEGEVVGYLGPNGAGKSTTIKLLTGILTPTAGTVLVNGLVPHRQRRENARRIGAVFGQRTQLWWDLPAIESLRILAAMYDVPAATYRENLALFERVLELGEFAAKPVRQLSLGQRMRMDLAAALLHNPSILYLDEPTIGMDVLVKEQVRQFVRRAAQERGTTVLLTTHDLRDVEQLCSRVLIIDHGRVIYEGTTDALKRTFGRERTLVVRLTSDAGETAPTPPPAADRAADLAGARLVARENGVARFAFPADANPQPVIAAVAAQYPIADLTLEEPDLEKIIREIYRRGSAA
jgi:ABC-2 type transport system ATP-binding protein